LGLSMRGVRSARKFLDNGYLSLSPTKQFKDKIPPSCP
jgi:hypothetical protein